MYCALKVLVYISATILSQKIQNKIQIKEEQSNIDLVFLFFFKISQLAFLQTSHY